MGTPIIDSFGQIGDGSIYQAAALINRQRARTIREKLEENMYYDADGNELTRDDIVKTVEERRAVLCWTHGDWKNVASLSIYDTADEAEIEAERDTRGDCWSMRDEVWCELCTDLGQALRAAKGVLSVS